MKPIHSKQVKDEHAKLDKYYTKPEVASQCVSTIMDVLKQNGIDPNQILWIEPSAGGGAFLNAAKERGLNAIGFDLLPESPDIIQNDFLNEDCFEKAQKISKLGETE